ncbi:efflux RND transporter periplasmic adaptor subunit [Lichenicoccus sp.]|uniref:efflux RND transporter periplasmic adaptor subunit n=1 Tax=Lichenicoccus sp. TaxID=2781899 RepID=UPI003D132DC8
MSEAPVRTRPTTPGPTPGTPGPTPGALPGQTPPGGPPRDAPRRRRPILPWIILLVVVGAITFALLRPHAKTEGGQRAGGHRGQHGAAGEAPQPVTEQAARTGDMPVTLTELGTVTPLATVTVQSQISGYLMQVNFQEGQEVHRGDQLALIDPRPYIATRDQYVGQLARDNALLGQARIDLARYQLLLRQHSIASQQADDQVYLVNQYVGTVRSDQAQIDSASLNIGYCHITAPVDGRVGLRQVDAGNYVTPGLANGLVVLTELHPISVIFSVPEDNLETLMTRLRAGAVLPVEAYDRTDTAHVASGRVAVVDNQVDVNTGTVKLRAVFDNKDERLFPSQFVNARLLLDTVHDAVLVPTNAVQTGPEGQFVYVVRRGTAASEAAPAPPNPKPDAAKPEAAKPEAAKPAGRASDTVTVRNITAGVSSSAETVITSGLQAGEVVVTDGTEHLREGSRVVVPPPPGAAAAPGQHRHHHRQAAQ